MDVPDIDMLYEVYLSFNRSVRTLINLMGQMQIDDKNISSSITSLRRKYTIIRAWDDSYMLRESAGIFLTYADKIKSRDVEYFLQADIISECKALNIEINPDDEAYTLIQNIRILYNNSDEKTRTIVIDQIVNMLEAVELVQEYQ